MTQISFGQLLQETAVAAALGQLQKGTPGASPNSSPKSYAKHPSATVSAPAAAAAGQRGGEECAGGSGVLQESNTAVQVLRTVPEDGLVTGPAPAEAVPHRTTHSRSHSRHQLNPLPAQLGEPPVTEGVLSGAASATMTAAAAALQELALASVRSEQDQLSSHQLGYSQSMPRSLTHTDSRNSSFADRHCLSTSSSMRASREGRATLSSSSSLVWRPGGNRTDPRDDYKKLQSYESARLRALQKAGLLSPGCSTRLLMAGGDELEAQQQAQQGSASPKSRRSTNADTTLLGAASPASPAAISGTISGSSRGLPGSPGSPGGYAAALLRRRAAAAGGSGCYQPSAHLNVSFKACIGRVLQDHHHHQQQALRRQQTSLLAARVCWYRPTVPYQWQHWQAAPTRPPLSAVPHLSCAGCRRSCAAGRSSRVSSSHVSSRMCGRT